MAGYFAPVSQFPLSLSVSNSLYRISIHISTSFPSLGMMWKIWKETIRSPCLTTGLTQLQPAAFKNLNLQLQT